MAKTKISLSCCDSYNPDPEKDSKQDMIGPEVVTEHACSEYMLMVPSWIFLHLGR